MNSDGRGSLRPSSIQAATPPPHDRSGGPLNSESAITKSAIYGTRSFSFPRPKYKACARCAGLFSDPVRPTNSRLKPDIPPDWRWRIPMKGMIVAALTVVSLGVGVANAQSFAHEMPPPTHQGTSK
jgi:hypothetical protein